MSPRAQKLAQMLKKVTARPAGSNQSIPVDPASFVDPATTNQDLFNSQNGPVTQANADGAQSLSVLVTAAEVVSARNIQGFSGGSMPASGMWKFTAIIRGLNYGKSTSVCYNAGTTIQAVIPAAQAWCKALSWLFGNAGSPSAYDFGPNDGSPVITYVRITDALNPRSGLVLPLVNTNGIYSGVVGAELGENSADFTSTALSLRMLAINANAPFNQAYCNHHIIYQPDAVVVNGTTIDLASLDGNGVFYSQRVKTYLQYLVKGGNQLGSMLQDPAQLKKPCTAFSFVQANNQWQCTCTGHGYTTGDRVRLTAVNAPGFRGSYKVNVVDANTLGLVNGPPTSVAAPTTGTVQRYQLASGVKCLVFGGYQLTLAQQTSTLGLRVTKVNPGRPFVPVSFKRRVRKLH